MSFLEGYETVETRLGRFWEKYPNGRVMTELVAHPEGVWLFRADIFRDATETTSFASGYAHEKETQKGVNSTSACENAETSAIGRALANGGFAPKGARASREEMSKTTSASPRGDGQTPASKERIAQLRAKVPEDKREWVKDTFGWPWTDADCEAISAALGIYPDGEEPF